MGAALVPKFVRSLALEKFWKNIITVTSQSVPLKNIPKRLLFKRILFLTTFMGTFWFLNYEVTLLFHLLVMKEPSMAKLTIAT